MFAIQDEIAHSIVDELKVRLLSDRDEPIVKRQTDDFEAYSLYLQGRYYWSRRYKGFMQRAIDCFDRLIERDPAYALAHAALADGLTVTAIWGWGARPNLIRPKASAAAARALALDDSLAEAYQADGLVKMFFDFDLASAEMQFRHALERRSAFGLAHGYHAMSLASLGRFTEAVVAAQRATTAEPVSPLVGFLAQLTHYFARDFDASLAEARRVVDLDPHFPLAYLYLSTSLTELGRHEDAIEAARTLCELANEASVGQLALGLALARGGRKREASGVVEEQTAKSNEQYVPKDFLALVCAELGDLAGGLRFLEEAGEERSCSFAIAGVAPMFDVLRGSRHFHQVLQTLGLREVPAPVSRRLADT